MKRSIIADSALLFVTFIWGTTFVIVQNAIQSVPPLTYNAIRFTLAAAMLALIITLRYRDQWKALTFKNIIAGSWIGIWLFAGYAFQTAGLLFTTSAKAGFITGLSVVLVPLLAVAMLKQRLSWTAWLGVASATAGLYLLSFSGTFSLNTGDVLVFFCAISFALQIILSGKYAPGISPLPLAFLQITAVAVLSTAGAFLFEDFAPGPVLFAKLAEPDVLWALLITAGPATTLAFWIQMVCQRHTSAARVALIFATEPVFAALTAVLVGGETLGGRAVAGCACILAGMLLAELKLTKSTI